MNKKKLGLLALWWGLVPLIWFIWRGVVQLFFNGYTWGQDLDQWLLANVLPGGWWLWLWLTVWSIISVAILAIDIYTEEGYFRTRRRISLTKNGEYRPLAVVMAVASVVGIVQITRVGWDNDKDNARYYNQAATFVVPNLSDPPASVKYLVKGSTDPSRKGCDMVDLSDMHTCIQEGTLKPEGWEPRVGSLDGARFGIKRTSGDRQNTSLDEDTLTYLNKWKGQSARWSGILDGRGKEQPLGGVSEWDGSHEITNCKFEGKYAIDRAFGGERGNSLPNLLAEHFPALRYKKSDTWGYCAGDEPIVVIPTTRQIRFKNRTVDTAGGLIIVRGQYGQVGLTYDSKAKAGEYPGPVYPMSLVERQRKMTQWSAGRKNNDRRGFGFEPATQLGNASEYLLRNEGTGRLEWVTPLTLRRSTSELFIAYAVTPADVVNSGHLNKLSLYVLDEDDPRRVNIDNLEADALDYLAKNAGTFISNGGRLVEFTPVDGDVWRAFGELNGRVVYLLQISAGDKINPRLVSVGATSNDKQGAEENITKFCGQSLSILTPQQLVNCIQAMADELNHRQQPNSNG